MNRPVSEKRWKRQYTFRAVSRENSHFLENRIRSIVWPFSGLLPRASHWIENRYCSIVAPVILGRIQTFESSCLRRPKTAAACMTSFGYYILLLIKSRLCGYKQSLPWLQLYLGSIWTTSSCSFETWCDDGAPMHHWRIARTGVHHRTASANAAGNCAACECDSHCLFSVQSSFQWTPSLGFSWIGNIW